VYLLESNIEGELITQDINENNFENLIIQLKNPDYFCKRILHE